MCAAHSYDSHIRANCPFCASLLAGCPQNRCPLCSWVWQHGLGRRQGTKPCGWPAGMPTVSRQEARTGSFPRATRDRHMPVYRGSPQVRWNFRMANYVCHRTDRLTGGGTASKARSTWRLLPSRLCWPVNRWNSWRFTCPPPCPWLLRMCLPALVLVFQSSWRVWLECQTRRMELQAEQDKRQNLASPCRRQFLSDLWAEQTCYSSL